MISIIIPVYNSEKYLRRTFESLLKQTYSDFEVIIVDDGSTDGSLKLCREYVEKDKRFIIIHQSNSGVSSARNAGIRQASGNIITFLDSDDYVSKSYCETIQNNLENMDLLVFQTCKHFDDGTRMMQITRTGDFIGKEEIEKGMLLLHNYRFDQLGWPWNKAFKRSLIMDTNLTFPEDMNWFEDEVFCMRYFAVIGSLRIIDNVIHHYRVREDSLTNNQITSDKLSNTADNLRKELSPFNNPGLRKSFIRQFYSFYLQAIIKEKNIQSKYQRFKKYYYFYNSEIKPASKLGVLGKIVFCSPCFIGFIVFLLFWRMLD